MGAGSSLQGARTGTWDLRDLRQLQGTWEGMHVCCGAQQALDPQGAV